MEQESDVIEPRLSKRDIIGVGFYAFMPGSLLYATQKGFRERNPDFTREPIRSCIEACALEASRIALYAPLGMAIYYNVFA